MQQQQQLEQSNNGNKSNNNTVVHVRGDSETELDRLFSVLNNNDSKAPGQTYRNKNLPLSFFQPPEKKQMGSGVHSREGSHDLNGYGTPGSMGVYHSRSHSSPAQLPLTMSLAPPLSLPLNPSHNKQGSLEMSSGMMEGMDPNWNNNTNNPSNNVVFNSNNNNINFSFSGPGTNTNTWSPVPAHPTSAEPLPPGWEQGVTNDGDVYYIDHINKRTSWINPRLINAAGKKGGVGVKGRLPGHPLMTTNNPNGASKHPNLLQQHSRLPPKSNQPAMRHKVTKANPMHSFQLQLLSQQQQLQQQHQLQHQLQQHNINNRINMLQNINNLNNNNNLSNSNNNLNNSKNNLNNSNNNLNNSNNNLNNSNNNLSSNGNHEQLIRLELEKLKREKERLAKESEEYQKREDFLLQELESQKHQKQISDINNNNPTSQVNISGFDAFLGLSQQQNNNSINIFNNTNNNNLNPAINNENNNIQPQMNNNQQQQQQGDFAFRNVAPFNTGVNNGAEIASETALLQQQQQQQQQQQPIILQNMHPNIKNNNINYNNNNNNNPITNNNNNITNTNNNNNTNSNNNTSNLLLSFEIMDGDQTMMESDELEPSLNDDMSNELMSMQMTDILL